MLNIYSTDKGWRQVFFKKVEERFFALSLLFCGFLQLVFIESK